MRSTRVLPADESALAEAIATLQRGGLVVLPTDTVYGLAAALDQPAVLQRVFAVKGRSSTKNLPILLAEAGGISLVASDVSPAVARFAMSLWPGPLTVALLAGPDIPPEAIGPGDTVGVRVPDHAFTRRLIAAAGGALAVTSANRSDEPETTTAAAVIAQIGADVDLVIDGGVTPGGRASTVVGFDGDRLLIFRAGPLSADELAAAWKRATAD